MTEVIDSSQPEFWDSRFAAGKTPWDLNGFPEELGSWLGSRSPERVLIPGCGRAHEVEAFYRAGWEVMAIDFSCAAVEQARERLGPLGRCVVHGDFFAHPLEAHSFDGVYERTFLCAIPPEVWRSYAERVARVLRPGGALFGVFYYGEEPEPPPYPLSQESAYRLFEPAFRLVEDAPVVQSLPIYGGKERWQVWQRQ